MDGSNIDASEAVEFQESPLDEKSHAECLKLYDESTITMRYAKSQQWRTLAFVSIVYSALLLLSYTQLATPEMIPMLIIISFVLSAAGISAVFIFQMWQSTEMRKLDYISHQMSDMFRETRALKSTFEANVQRYAILFFMVAFIITANALTYMVLARFLNM